MSPTRAITGAPTSITAFLGTAPAGPQGSPQSVSSFADFARIYGAGSPLEPPVQLFFANGGNSAWIVRTSSPAQDLTALDRIETLNLVALPGASEPAILRHAVDYCSARGSLLLVDPPRGLSPTQVQEWVSGSPVAGAEAAGIYYPWLRVADAARAGRMRAVPASGAVAGIIGRIDAAHGVWTAPAGKEAIVRGAGGLAVSLSEVETVALSSAGINGIRRMPSIGLAVWGARTAAGTDGNTSEYKYVSVRRLRFYIEESTKRGLAWAAFEPNGEQLWDNVRRAVEDFLLNLWQTGALQGTKPEQALFVRCDHTTMTQDDIDNGRLIVEIGIAPLRPAEFVVVRIQALARRPE